MGYCAEPNAKRLALVSCADRWPAKGGEQPMRVNSMGKTVHDVMQDNILHSLSRAQARAEKKGWRPAEDWKESQTACDAHHEYFDLQRRPLNDMLPPPSKRDLSKGT